MAHGPLVCLYGCVLTTGVHHWLCFVSIVYVFLVLLFSVMLQVIL